MQKYSGTSVFGGVAIGRLFVYVKDGQQVRRTAITDIPAEIERFDKARLAAEKDLDELYEKAVKEAGQDNAEIFTVHKMMLEDDSFKDSVYNIIEEQSVNAEYAVATTEDNLYEIFMGLEDEYMRGRAADIRDISE
jgi:phosphotransferase system enzyme I (PtsI)